MTTSGVEDGSGLPGVRVLDWQAWPSVASAWRDLVARCGHATFFVTAEWVQTWMDTFGAELKPTILLFGGEAGRLEGACLLVRRTERKGPFSIRRLYLNTSGEDDRDSPCIEFNTLLCEPGYELTMARQLHDYLHEIRPSAPWDELCAPGFVGGAAFDAFQTAFRALQLDDQVKPSHYVALNEVRDSSKEFAETLSSRERTRFRQNLRKFQQRGEVKIEAASTVEEAYELLDELIGLHQKTWRERGFPGSFSSGVFSEFHRRLIARCLPLGQVQLLRFRAGEATVGCLYNFVFRSRVYFYQCGYHYPGNEKLSPGMTAQVAAVAHAAKLGLDEYDFMAGDLDYKKKLANRQRELHWATWQTRSVKMRTFELLRRTRRQVREHSVADVKDTLLDAVRKLRPRAPRPE